MVDRRFVLGDAFAVFGQLRLAAANRFRRFGDGDFQFQCLRFARLRLAGGRGALIGKSLELLLERGQFFAQPAPVRQADLRPQLLQPVGVFLVTPRLGGLHPHAAQPVLHLVDDVRQTKQVLLNAFQPPQRFNLLGLEAADAGGFFKISARRSRGEACNIMSTLPCSMML